MVQTCHPWLLASERLNTVIRNILAVVVGILAGSAFNMALVTLSHAIYPLPENVDPNDLEAFRAYVETEGLAAGAMMIVLAAHAGGSFVSGIVCGLIARRVWYAAAAGLGIFWMCGGIAMLVMIPAPLWFAIADIVLYLPSAVLGVRLGGAWTGRVAPAAAID